MNRLTRMVLVLVGALIAMLSQPRASVAQGGQPLCGSISGFGCPGDKMSLCIQVYGGDCGYAFCSHGGQQIDCYIWPGT